MFEIRILCQDEGLGAAAALLLAHNLLFDLNHIPDQEMQPQPEPDPSPAEAPVVEHAVAETRRRASRHAVPVGEGRMDRIVLDFMETSTGVEIFKGKDFVDDFKRYGYAPASITGTLSRLSGAGLIRRMGKDRFCRAAPVLPPAEV